MLHYTDRELVYHCPESRACECGGLSETQEGLKRSLPSFFTSEPSATSFSGKPTSSEPRNAQTFRQQHLFKLKLDNLYPSEKSRWGQVARPIHFGELWEDILKAYTRTRLAYDHDILLALSGVSRLMQAYNPGGFYAGLWGVDILYQLTWRSGRQNEEHFPPRRPECYTAPSFSWASRIGPVSFPYNSVITSTCTIFDVHCDLVDTNPFGQVSGGYITLRGRLLSGEIQQFDYPPEELYSNKPRSGWLFVPERSADVNDGHTLSDSECAENCWESGKLNCVTLDANGDSHDVLNGPLHCFELFQSHRKFEPLPNSHCDHSTALLLQRSSTGYFQRIGMVEHASCRQFKTANIEQIVIK
jgi:hypothetical protein